MKYLSDNIARVQIRPWYNRYTLEYSIHHRKQFGPYLTGLIHLDKGNISLDYGHLQNLFDVKIIYHGLNLILKYLSRHYPTSQARKLNL